MRHLLPLVAVSETDNKDMVSRSQISPHGNELFCTSKGRKEQDMGPRPTQSLQASCCNFNMALIQLQHGTYTTQLNPRENDSSKTILQSATVGAAENIPYRTSHPHIA